LKTSDWTMHCWLRFDCQERTIQMSDPAKTTRALRLAAEFLQQLRFGEASRLPPDLARQVPYLLRHFPTSSEIADYARHGAYLGDPGRWLHPEVDEPDTANGEVKS